MRAFPISRKLRIKIKIHKKAMDMLTTVVLTYLDNYSPLQLPGYSHSSSCQVCHFYLPTSWLVLGRVKPFFEERE